MAGRALEADSVLDDADKLLYSKLGTERGDRNGTQKY
jgi:hypothetical protein